MGSVPDFVTHYYLADRRPFLNLCDLDDDDIPAVLGGLVALRQSGKQHRPFGAKYMVLRRAAEARLRDLFKAAGGRLDRISPHYFVLGESSWYCQLATNMRAVRLPLEALPPDKTSITYPDSFTAMGFGPQFQPTMERPDHGRVYLLHELSELVDRHGVPSPTWEPNHITWTNWPDVTYIEVQLWTDDPVRAYLA